MGAWPNRLKKQDEAKIKIKDKPAYIGGTKKMGVA